MQGSCCLLSMAQLLSAGRKAKAKAKVSSRARASLEARSARLLGRVSVRTALTPTTGRRYKMPGPAAVLAMEREWTCQPSAPHFTSGDPEPQPVPQLSATGTLVKRLLRSGECHRPSTNLFFMGAPSSRTDDAARSSSVHPSLAPPMVSLDFPWNQM